MTADDSFEKRLQERRDAEIAKLELEIELWRITTAVVPRLWERMPEFRAAYQTASTSEIHAVVRDAIVSNVQGTIDGKPISQAELFNAILERKVVPTLVELLVERLRTGEPCSATFNTIDIDSTGKIGAPHDGPANEQ